MLHRAFVVALLSSLAFFANSPTAFASPHQHVAHDYESLEEASRSIQTLSDELRALGDRRALFPAIYAITISASDRELKKGRFQAPEWTRQLMINYANLYRRTIFNELTQQNQDVPRAWQVAFQYTRRADWSPEVDAVYGINVHIARDLVEALMVTPTDFDNEKMRGDFYFISDILKSAMPKIWAVFHLYPRALALPSFIEKQVMTSWIASLRHRVWMNAKSVRHFPLAKKYEYLDQIDRKAARQARQFGLLLPLFGE